MEHDEQGRPVIERGGRDCTRETNGSSTAGSTHSFLRAYAILSYTFVLRVDAKKKKKKIIHLRTGRRNDGLRIWQGRTRRRNGVLFLPHSEW